MSRPLNEIIAHIRAVSANPAIRTTLIQTEDLEALCDAAASLNRSTVAEAVSEAIRRFSSPIVGRGVHEGQRGYIIYEGDGLPFVISAITEALLADGEQSPRDEQKAPVPCKWPDCPKGDQSPPRGQCDCSVRRI